jgi:glutamate dehydrogenase/leucine dehydrogenase
VGGEVGVGEGVGGEVGEDMGVGRRSGRRRFERRFDVDVEEDDVLTGLEGVRKRHSTGVGFGEQGGVRMSYQVVMGEVNVCVVEM